MKNLIIVGFIAALAGLYLTNEKKEKSEVVKSEIVKPQKEETKLLKRSEIDNKYKWNMTDFYPDWAEWDKDLETLKSMMKEIPQYKGQIKDDSKKFVELIKLEEKMGRLLDKLYVYVYMLKDLDSKDEVSSVKLQEIQAIYTEYSVSAAWITPEILQIPKETMERWIDENPELKDNRFGLMEIYRLQGHVLDEGKEKLLSYYGQYMGAPHDIYAELSISDMKWNEVKLSDGYEGPVTNGVYSKVLATNRNQEDRKKALGLKEYHYYDNSINIVEYDKTFDYDVAKEMVYNSVAPLGEDYSAKMNRAISEGWIDVFETENKRSGAYSIGIYDVHPYMLLNYQSTLDDVFTLAHELGHTLHTMLSNENQPYATHDYTIFVAEVASTFNERLLLDYMIKNSNDPIEKIALIEQALGNIVGTFYIQTLFANYEYQAHKLIEEGKAVTPDVLSGIMDNLFKEYFGDSITMDELQKIIWARIPHFFNSPYYVYQYATSFASSANLYDRITNTKYSEEERTKAKEDYLTLLKSGGNDHPMSQLKKAGVDLEKVESFHAVAVEFDRLLDILEEELNKLEK